MEGFLKELDSPDIAPHMHTDRHTEKTVSFINERHKIDTDEVPKRQRSIKKLKRRLSTFNDLNQEELILKRRLKLESDEITEKCC